MSAVDTSKKEDAKISDGEGEFIQVRKKSDKVNHDSKPNDKKKNKSRSRNNSLGEGKPSKPR